MPRKPPKRPQDQEAILKEIGKNIRQLREDDPLTTQAQLAEQVGIDVRDVQLAEAGNRDMRVTTLVKYKRAFNCSWDDILPQ